MFIKKKLQNQFLGTLLWKVKHIKKNGKLLTLRFVLIWFLKFSQKNNYYNIYSATYNTFNVY